MEQMKTTKRHIVIVTGLSGAGKTGVMRALEDIGFYCVDNLPVPLLQTFLTLCAQTDHVQKIALGIDARNELFLSHLIHEIEHLKKEQDEQQLSILFLTAQEHTLIKRFQETRRTHPLAHALSLSQAIAKERILLTPIMSMADLLLETDTFTIHGLREWVRTVFTQDKKKHLLISLISFGFKYGIPTESNLLFDLRFLPNPYFIPELRALDGRHEQITAYLFSQPSVQEYWKSLYALITTTTEYYLHSGHTHITLCIGCTGGKHRSVAFIEKIHNTGLEGVTTLINHRDLGKE